MLLLDLLRQFVHKRDKALIMTLATVISVFTISLMRSPIEIYIAVYIYIFADLNRTTGILSYYNTAFEAYPATTSRPRTNGRKSSASRFEETRSRTRNEIRARLRMQMRGHRGAQRRDRYQFFSRSDFLRPTLPSRSRSRTSRITI